MHFSFVFTKSPAVGILMNSMEFFTHSKSLKRMLLCFNITRLIGGLDIDMFFLI